MKSWQVLSPPGSSVLWGWLRAGLSRSLPGRNLDDRRVCKGNDARTGGGAPSALLQGKGWGAAVSRDAQPATLPLPYDGTQSRSLESDPRCNTSRLSEATFGGNGAELL